MGVHYSRDFWHYSDARYPEQFAVKLTIERDTRAGYQVDAVMIWFYDNFTDGRTAFFRKKDNERFERFLNRCMEGVIERGLPLEDSEVERLHVFLEDSIVNMGKVRVRKDEIIND